MVPTLIASEILIVFVVALAGRHKPNSERLDTMRMTYTILAIINGGTAGAWLLAAAFAAQYPTFNLSPLIAAALVLSIAALRANQLHRKQRTSPA